MEIVFNINPLGMQGLGATLSSLVRNCSQSASLVLNFLCADLSAQDKKNIETLLQEERFEGEVRFIDFDPMKEFGHLRSLHGDWTTYGRLLIPDRIEADRVLYLDADLAINLDVLELDKTVSLDGHVLAAVSDCTIDWTIDQTLLKDRVGLDGNTPYFNAGLVFFNLKECRERNAAQEWQAFAAKFKDELVSHDQTVLNAYARGSFVNLPVRFNLPWPATLRVAPKDASNAVVHFIGAPKPWDFGGQWLHAGYSCWSDYTTPFWRRAYGGMVKGSATRLWRIRRSMAKALRSRLGMTA